MANIALSVLDEHFARKWEALGPYWPRAKRRKAGVPAYRLVRYADDFVVMVGGTRQHAEALWDETSKVLAPIGLRLSEEKTRVCHIDEGFDFLGFRIQRDPGEAGPVSGRSTPTHQRRPGLGDGQGQNDHPPTEHRTLADLLRLLNRVLRGWCNYFRHGVSAQTFSYLYHSPGGEWWVDAKRHDGRTGNSAPPPPPGWEIRDGQTEMFRPTRSRSIATATGAAKSPHDGQAMRHEPVESRMLRDGHVRVGGRIEDEPAQSRHRASVRPLLEAGGPAKWTWSTCT